MQALQGLPGCYEWCHFVFPKIAKRSLKHGPKDNQRSGSLKQGYGSDNSPNDGWHSGRHYGVFPKVAKRGLKHGRKNDCSDGSLKQGCRNDDYANYC